MEDLKKLLAAATPGPWTHASDKLAAGNIKAPDNAALIVAAVNALPELLAEVRRLEADLQVIAFGWRYVAEPDNSFKKVDWTRDQLIEYARAALNQKSKP